jgi:general L-amino acid transport system substrate-binding protein
VGNYGEVFERNLGKSTKFKMDRNLNALWSQGGLHYPIPFK